MTNSKLELNNSVISLPFSTMKLLTSDNFTVRNSMITRLEFLDTINVNWITSLNIQINN